MKQFLLYTVLIFLISSCSSDNVNDIEEIQETEQSENDSEDPQDDDSQDDDGQDDSDTLIFYGDVTLTTQSEVTDFGVNDYQEITGRLIIEGSDITNLETLSNLKSVGRDLFIGDTQLVNLNGLDNLSTIGETFNEGDLEIYRNDNLRSIEALSLLASIPGTLEIRSNFSLESLQGLHSLTNIRTIVRIVKNSSLNDIHALHNVDSELIGINIDMNFSLENLNGLENMKLASNGGLSLLGNTILSDVSMLESLIQDRARVILIGPRYDNCPDGCPDEEVPVLSQLSFLTNLRNVDTLVLGEYQGTDLEGLNQLESIGNLSIFGSRSKIQSLSALSGIQSGIIDLRITDQNYIASLEGLNNVVSLSRVNIENNTTLANFCSIATPLIEAFQNNGSNVSIKENAYNPEAADLENGECSL